MSRKLKTVLIITLLLFPVLTISGIIYGNYADRRREVNHEAAKKASLAYARELYNMINVNLPDNKKVSPPREQCMEGVGFYSSSNCEVTFRVTFMISSLEKAEKAMDSKGFTIDQYIDDGTHTSRTYKKLNHGRFGVLERNSNDYKYSREDHPVELSYSFTFRNDNDKSVVAPNTKHCKPGDNSRPEVDCID